jgi:beta-lactam-binding protein with PASTA domain
MPGEAAVTSATKRAVRWIAPHSRTSGVLLVCALLAGVLVATIGAGYTASRSLLDSGGAVLAKGGDLVYANPETGKIEAEARGLAKGKNAIEIVTLADGQVAVVDTPANKVWLVDPGTMRPKGPIDLPDTPEPNSPSQDKPIVLGAPDSGYLGSGDVVAQIDQDGKQVAQAKLPARLTGPAVPDPVEGIWVLVEDGQVVHAVRGEIRDKDTVPADRQVEHLTIADGHPIGVTAAGDLLDLSARPLRRIVDEPVPAGRDVVVGSASGAGRWILAVDPHQGRMAAVDVHTGTSRTFDDLPDHKLGQPVQVGDRVYIPDYTKHLLHVIDIGLDRRLEPIKVPGKAPTFALEVLADRVWANDQSDQRVRVIHGDGSSELIDTGDGRGLSDTEKPNEPPAQEPDRANEPEPPRPPQDRPSPPNPEPKPAPAPIPQPAPKVAVPSIAPGTPIDQACRQIQQVGLECVPVAVGDGGGTDTVIDQEPTDPPAGTPVPKRYRVVVRHYGPTAVPDVVGQYTDNACKLLTDARLKCAKQPRPDVAPRPEDLDVVKDQTPAVNTKTPTGADVTIGYFDKAPMYDYAGQTGAEACAAFKQTYRTIGCQVVEGATEQQQPGKSPGVVYAQQPAAGAIVQMGDSTSSTVPTVTFTVVKGSPYRVPDVRNQSPENACAILAQNGLGCDARPDQIARNRVVTAQDTPPGTPLDGGTIVIHYAPYEPVPLRIYQRTNGDPVYVLRRDGYVNPDYAIDRGVIGYGYEAGTPQPYTAPLFGHWCVGNPTKCLGFDRNHYVSRGGAVFHPGWEAQTEAGALRVIATCGTGMVNIYRVLKKPGGRHEYSIQTAPVPDVYNENLGCLWL